MATLQKLRNQAGLLLAIVIGLAMVGFVLGDLLRSGSTLLRGNQMEIAEIEGSSVDYQEFQSRLEELVEIYKMNSQQSSLDDATYQQAYNQTWETLVQEKVMEDIYEDLGIDVSSDEMFDMVQGNNISPIVNQLFADPNTGQFNREQVIRFLKYIEANPDAPQASYWTFLEKQIYQTRKLEKYNNAVAKGLYANSLQAQTVSGEKAKTVSLNYISKKYSEVSDSLITVTESDLKEYYNDHSKEYKQNESRNIEFVVFDIKPSKEDDKATAEWVKNIQAEFTKADDNVQFVNMNSDSRFDETYMKKEDVPLTLREWAFSANEGDVFGPYNEGNAYKLAKINHFKMLPDSVKASHILIRIADANAAMAAQVKADSLVKLLENGANFEELARANSEDTGSGAQGGDLGWFAKNRMVKPFETAAFNAEIGEIVTANSQFGIHIIKTTAKSKLSNHVQIAMLDRNVSHSTQTYQKIYSAANKFASEVGKGDAFDTAVADAKVNKRFATIGKNDRNITGLESARQIVRAAYKAKVGDVIIGGDNSAVFELTDKFVIGIVSGETEEGVQPFSAVRTRVDLAVRKEKKAEYIAVEMAKSGSSLNNVASALNLTIDKVENTSLSYGSIGKIGYEPAVVGAAASLTQGSVSKPIEGRNGVYMIEMTDVAIAETGDLAAEQKSILQNQSYRFSYQVFATVRDNADIEDNRSNFY